MAERALKDLERVLGYAFRHRHWLEQALTHGSSREDLPPGTPVQDYERLEFLGDAVLDLVVAEHLMRTQPDWDEGQMTKARTRFVSRRGLEGIVSRLGIAPYVKAGPGLERADERGRRRVFADVYEALAGAIYMDSGGLPAVADFIRRTLLAEPPPKAPAAPRKPAPSPRPAARPAPRPVARPRPHPPLPPPPRPRAPPREPAPRPPPSKADYKSALQDFLQKSGRPKPEYRTLRAVGPEHQKTWFVEVHVPPEIRTTGKGLTKKDAEQRAALKALLEVQGPPPRLERARRPPQTPRHRR